MFLADELKKVISGDVLSDEVSLAEYSHDASLFEVKPQVVVFPKDVDDLGKLIKFVSEKKKDMPGLSLTARAAGTDMSGGPLTESIVVGFKKYFNKIKSVNAKQAVAEPGVFYRDFEKETLKYNALLPSYPASRELCAMGGIVNNNSGGEKTLKYGKTENYVEALRVVLADGNEYVFKALTEKELAEKLTLQTFEGQVYRKMDALIKNNEGLIESARPKVSKNSAGYYLWNIINKAKKTFDLSAVFVGAQGTLGFVTEATIRLVPIPKYARMLVIFMDDLAPLGELTNKILKYQPESFESYDDNTLKLALKYFASFAKLMGAKNVISTGWKFLPEFLMVLSGGIPKLVLQVEFTGDNEDELAAIIDKLKAELAPYKFRTRVAGSKEEAKKYWIIRRESFNLLRNRIKGKHTAPFIDDVVVNPEKLPEFLPQLNNILKEYHLTYTLAGHIGNGNFHIIPLMDFKNPVETSIIPELSDKVYALVLKFGGSITGEHNDGLIRSPYLKAMYGEAMYKLFEEVNRIFDPQDIFNPGKKVSSDKDFMVNHIRKD